MQSLPATFSVARRAGALLAAFTLVALPLLAADGEELDRRRFRLGKGGVDRSVVDLDEPGILSTRVRVRSPLPSSPVELVFTAPDGTRVEKNSNAPMTLEHAIGPESLGRWTVEVVNIAKIGELVGDFRVHFEARATVAAPQDTPNPVTAPEIPASHAGTVVPAQPTGLRAVCVGSKNDVEIRLDLEAGHADLLLGFNPVARFEVEALGQDTYRLQGQGEPLILDLERRSLGFTTGQTGRFCQVRIYR